MADVWRGYIVERLLWELGGIVAYASPLVTQYRPTSPHPAAADWSNERPLHLKTGELLQALAGWTRRTESHGAEQPMAQVPLETSARHG